jgi:hypothetical protein
LACWWLGDLRLDGQFAPTFGPSNGSGRIASCTLSSDSSCQSLGGGPLSLVIQPDGDYVVFTYEQIWRTQPQAHTLDIAGVVGGTGFVNSSFPINNVEGSVEALYGFPPLADGKIFAEGQGAYSGASGGAFGFVRLNSDLSLDTTFNAITDGNGVIFAGGSVVTINAADDAESPSAALIQPDGKMIAVGSGYTYSTNLREKKSYVTCRMDHLIQHLAMAESFPLRRLMQCNRIRSRWASHCRWHHLRCDHGQH